MYTDMQSTLDAIPTSFDLTDEQNTDYNNLLSIFTIAKDMYENDNYMDGLSQTQKDTLEDMLALQRPYVSQLALSLLKRDDPEFVYNEVIIEPDGLYYGPSPGLIPENNTNNTESLLTVYPNPAYTHFTLRYKTSEMRYMALWMRMHDSNGKLVLSKRLKGGDNEELIGLDEISQGSYTVGLYADERVVAIKILNVVK